MLRLNLDNDSSLSCDTKILRPVLNLKVPISHHAHSKCQIMIEINIQSPSEITRSKRPYFLASFWSACRLGKGQHKVQQTRPGSACSWLRMAFWRIVKSKRTAKLRKRPGPRSSGAHDRPPPFLECYEVRPPVRKNFGKILWHWQLRLVWT